MMKKQLTFSPEDYSVHKRDILLEVNEITNSNLKNANEYVLSFSFLFPLTQSHRTKGEARADACEDCLVRGQDQFCNFVNRERMFSKQVQRA